MTNTVNNSKQPRVCDYEGSDYQTKFWKFGGRDYEDACESIALRNLMPEGGNLLLEVGAGAGRNTTKYKGYNHIVLQDFSKSQLLQAKARLGNSAQYIYVVSDVYHLPFINNLFDAATMIRVLHHMVDAPLALQRIRDTLKPGSTFILEYANKRNLKAIIRYGLRRQDWNPFTHSPVEFVTLNFNFHPHYIQNILTSLNFKSEKTLTVSHFRLEFLKSHIPVKFLVALDSLFHWTGKFTQLTPSVFLRARLAGQSPRGPVKEDIVDYFKCPDCGNNPLIKKPSHLHCPVCLSTWPIEEGMFIFRR